MGEGERELIGELSGIALLTMFGSLSIIGRERGRKPEKEKVMKTKVNTKYEYVEGEGEEMVCDSCEQLVSEWFANYYHEVCDECYHNYYAKEGK